MSEKSPSRLDAFDQKILFELERDGMMTAAPHIAGQICALSDLRDYRSCTARGGTFRVTVEETREQTMTNTQPSDDQYLPDLGALVERSFRRFDPILAKEPG